MIEKPFNQIKELLSKEIPEEYIRKLPNKWEKVGEVVTITLSNEFENYKETIGNKYAEILECKTVLNNIGGITGEFRTPNVEVIFGSNDSETIHRENGIRYKLDPQKVMFSS